MIRETVRLAIFSIRRNVLRSVLTLLGIVIGVAAVIAMLTIGSGTTERVRSDIAKLGSNLLVVRSARPDRSGSTSFTPRRLDGKDVAALAGELTSAKAVSAVAAEIAQMERERGKEKDAVKFHRWARGMLAGRLAARPLGLPGS